MTSATSELPGYYPDDGLPWGFQTAAGAPTGALCTLPWPREAEEKARLIRTSLGPAAIRWAEEHLVAHLTGRPWRFTAGQKRFLILWYSVTPDGRWRYRSGVKRGAKGTGKDPMGAAWCLLELLGPVRVVDMDADRPVGEAHRMPLVQIAANSEAQAKDVLRVANAMLPRDTRDLFGVDCGETRTNLVDGGRLELLTASEKTAEGDPATAVMLNESHHMTEGNGGHAVAAVARRNVGKSPAEIQARLCEFTNAHRQGGDSVAERSFEAWQTQVAGRARRQDILYDSVEAEPALGAQLHDDAARMRALTQSYADAPWSDLERLSDEVLDPRTAVADSIRFYLNGLAAAEDAWIDPGKFDTAGKPDVTVVDGEQVAVFLDCSKSEDATGLVGCRISDGHVFTLGVWQRPHGDRGKGWLAPRAEVSARVDEVLDRYDVVWLGIDPSPTRDDDTEALYWADLTDDLHRRLRDRLQLWATPGKGGSAVLFDMRLSQPGGNERNRLFTGEAERTAAAIDDEGSLTHDGHPALRVHTHNARRRPNRWGVSLGKQTRDSRNLVDLAVCMVGARLGRRLWLDSGLAAKQKKPRTGNAVFV